MNGLELVRKAVHGERVERFPVFPISIAAAARHARVHQRDYFLDPGTMAETLLTERSTFDFDGIYVSKDNWVFHEALGGKLEYPEDDETKSSSPLLESVGGYTKLPFPNPADTPPMRRVLESARIVMKRAGDDSYIQANIDSGPFGLACILRSVQAFMYDLYDQNEQTLTQFLEYCTDLVIAYGEAMISTGVHGIQMGESASSLLTPNLFERFVVPYLGRAVDTLKGRGCDVWVHVCGNSSHVLPLMREIPIAGLEIDAAVPLAEARRLIRPEVCLKGNLNTSFLLQETPGAVYDESLRLLEASGMTSGLVFSPGCGVPKMTPPENLDAMVRACRDFVIPANRHG